MYLLHMWTGKTVTGPARLSCMLPEFQQACIVCRCLSVCACVCACVCSCVCACPQRVLTHAGPLPFRARDLVEASREVTLSTLFTIAIKWELPRLVTRQALATEVR